MWCNETYMYTKSLAKNIYASSKTFQFCIRRQRVVPQQFQYLISRLYYIFVADASQTC